jgi:hypothetical protein
MAVNPKSLDNLQPSVHLLPGRKPSGRQWKNVRFSGTPQQFAKIEAAIRAYAKQEGIRPPQAATHLMLLGSVFDAGALAAVENATTEVLTEVIKESGILEKLRGIGTVDNA